MSTLETMSNALIARATSRRFSTRHTEFRVQPSAIDLLDTLVYHHDGPFADSSAIPTYLVSQLTRQHVTVALTGDGGDEVFAGYLRFGAAVAAGYMPAWAGRAASAALTVLPSPPNERHLVARAKRFTRYMQLPLQGRLAAWAGVFYDDLESLLTPGIPSRSRWRSSRSRRTGSWSRRQGFRGSPATRCKCTRKPRAQFRAESLWRIRRINLSVFPLN